MTERVEYVGFAHGALPRIPKTSRCQNEDAVVWKRGQVACRVSAILVFLRTFTEGDPECERRVVVQAMSHDDEWEGLFRAMRARRNVEDVRLEVPIERRAVGAVDDADLARVRIGALLDGGGHALEFVRTGAKPARVGVTGFGCADHRSQSMLEARA